MEKGFELEQVGIEGSDLAAAEELQGEGGEHKSDVLEIVVGTLLRRFSRVELVAEPRWRPNPDFRGLETLIVAIIKANP
jgi:hypothetical protein